MSASESELGALDNRRTLIKLSAHFKVTSIWAKVFRLEFKCPFRSRGADNDDGEGEGDGVASVGNL